MSKHTPFPWTYCGQNRPDGKPCVCLTVHGTHAPIFSVERGEWGEHFKGEFCAYGYIPPEVAEANFMVILDALRKVGAIQPKDKTPPKWAKALDALIRAARRAMPDDGEALEMPAASELDMAILAGIEALHEAGYGEEVWTTRNGS